jgi:hypothetical protein
MLASDLSKYQRARIFDYNQKTTVDGKEIGEGEIIPTPMDRELTPTPGKYTLEGKVLRNRPISSKTEPLEFYG